MRFQSLVNLSQKIQLFHTYLYRPDNFNAVIAIECRACLAFRN
ncbi:MAG: hypothetical protein QNJ51_14260 [Calothrix sp. MO_167.B12]|nr:hypothetical protein [Calothrix sp. MO_167.B12]